MTQPRSAKAFTAWPAIIAGLGMAYYLVAGVALHFLRPDYSLLQSGMSCYAVGPWGWLETAAFALDGLSLAALTAGLWRGIAPQGRSRAGLLLLGLVAVGRILEAALPTDVPPGPVPRTPVGVAHFGVAFLVFLAVTAAVLLISRRLAKDAAWRPFAPTARRGSPRAARRNARRCAGRAPRR
mgnify:CR=1 FL=1